jgi:hypothetical protein
MPGGGFLPACSVIGFVVARGMNRAVTQRAQIERHRCSASRREIGFLHTITLGSSSAASKRSDRQLEVRVN